MNFIWRSSKVFISLSIRITYRFPTRKADWSAYFPFLFTPVVIVQKFKRRMYGRVMPNPVQDGALSDLWQWKLSLFIERKGAAEPSNFLANGSSFNVSHSPFRVCVSRSCPADINPPIYSHAWSLPRRTPFQKPQVKKFQQQEAPRKLIVKWQLLLIWAEALWLEGHLQQENWGTILDRRQQV